ncbi:MAG: hypothetical protein IPK85_00445 [Gemmatimonadetes bacterium]|nr:hypothetical protein [Gemmatimonadota bacterium]
MNGNVPVFHLRDTWQVTGEPSVGKKEGCLPPGVAGVLEIRWHDEELAGDLKDADPLTDGWNGDAEWCGEVRLDEQLARASASRVRNRRKVERSPHVEHGPHVTFEEYALEGRTRTKSDRSRGRKDDLEETLRAAG